MFRSLQTMQSGLVSILMDAFNTVMRREFALVPQELWLALNGMESKRIGRPSKKHGVIPH